MLPIHFYHTFLIVALNNIIALWRFNYIRHNLQNIPHSTKNHSINDHKLTILYVFRDQDTNRVSDEMELSMHPHIILSVP